MIDFETEHKIVKLNYQYVRCIDEDRLEEWPDFFTDDCSYIIHPRENADAGLEGYWMYCENKAMLRDRVVALRHANIYDIHYDRHLLSNVLVTGREDDCYIVRTNYLVIHTNVEGLSRVFSAGEYRDRVVFVAGEPKFQEKVVVPDTFNVEGLLAIPL